MTRYSRYLSISEIILVCTILALFLSGFAIVFLNQSPSISFNLSDVTFQISERGRFIELYVCVEKGSVEIKQFFVNNLTVYNWSSDKRIILEGEKVKCVLEYPWKVRRDYYISLVTTDDRSKSIIVKAPEIALNLNVKILEVSFSQSSGFLKLYTTYHAEGNLTDSLHILFLAYLSFERTNRTIYIFYDPDYMAAESLKRATAITNYFSSYNITLRKVDYSGLKELSMVRPRIVLILLNPLKDIWGRRLENAIPAPLVDSNVNGYIRDDSIYGRSLLYDWMRDGGLIFVTVGSLQPYKKILYENGSYTYAKDSLEAFDAHLFLTDASGKESIIKGSFTLGNYMPVRISGTLGLSYREASFGFDKDSMARYGLEYYAYGDYKLPYGQTTLNLTLPVFIRVGRGGWLAIGEEEFWLSDGELAHDLFLICVQAVWDSKWIPYGWYWDSCVAFHTNPYGIIRNDGILETSPIPAYLIGRTVVIRVVSIAYSSDLEGGFLREHIKELSVP